MIDELLLNPELELDRINYLPQSEKEQLLRQFNNTDVSFDDTITVLNLIQEQVQRYENKIAVKDTQKAYTYKELVNQSNAIAAYLIQVLGKGNNKPLGVLVDRSADLLILLLSIFKSGRSYIPLDPSFPKKRLQYIIEHSQIDSIIIDSQHENVINKESFRHIIETETLIHLAASSKVEHDIHVTGKDTAYIIYTSGSTGFPKGVEIPHNALSNFLIAMKKRPGFKIN